MEPSIECRDRSYSPGEVSPYQVHRVRCIRPSLLDLELPNEPSIAPCQCLPQVAVLYLMNRPVAIIPATAFDQASLASCLANLRIRAPRCAFV